MAALERTPELLQELKKLAYVGGPEPEDEWNWAGSAYPGFRFERSGYGHLAAKAVIPDVSIEWEEKRWDFGDYSVEIPAVPDDYMIENYMRITGTKVCSEGDHYHPHVHRELPCLGEAKVPFLLAVRQGRWEDALNVLASMLQTYNAESAYREIDYWSATFGHCSDCGDRVEELDEGLCPSCYEARRVRGLKIQQVVLVTAQVRRALLEANEDWAQQGCYWATISARIQEDAQ